ncbi:MAG: hypothetical protein AUJ04_04640 [Acidobacteria bacterium 13_1_40CM_3_55_6]|nr:MAG: hypothetical protein AUJ04_04640 [Acidobacteria bacterium 13_1_40CM_3_55_6]
MKTRKIILILLPIGVVIASGACRRQSQSVPQSTNSNLAVTQEKPAGGEASVGERTYFRGTIAAGANNLKIEMTLVRDGERVSGSYFYPKVGKNIELNGTVDKDANVDLREKDDSGKETGIFKGKWKTAVEPYELGMANIAGKWSRPDGAKETTFELTQQPIDFSAAAARFVPKVIKEANKQSRFRIDVVYPQIEGDARFDKFNKEARAMVTKNVAAFKTSETSNETDAGSEIPAETQTSTLDSDYQIRLAADDLISIEFTESAYSRGAAHPNSYTTVLNYDVRNGKKLALADLFNAKSNYVKVISDYCIKDLKQQAKKEKDSMLTDDMIQSGASARAENFKAWTITKQGLWITFDPYQVAAYAAGPQQVLVPYSALKDLIKADGPIAAFAQ